MGRMAVVKIYLESSWTVNSHVNCKSGTGPLAKVFFFCLVSDVIATSLPQHCLDAINHLGPDEVPTNQIMTWLRCNVRLGDNETTTNQTMMLPRCCRSNIMCT